MLDDHEDREAAAAALTDIRHQQQLVIERAMIPGWFWWVIAGLVVLLSAAVDSQRLVVIGVAGTLFVFGVLAATGRVVLVGQRQARVSQALLGRIGLLAILGFVGLVLTVSLLVSFVLQGADVVYSATWGAVFGAVVMVAGGPRLMQFVRRTMLANRSGSHR